MIYETLLRKKTGLGPGCELGAGFLPFPCRKGIPGYRNVTPGPNVPFFFPVRNLGVWVKHTHSSKKGGWKFILKNFVFSFNVRNSSVWAHLDWWNFCRFCKFPCQLRGQKGFKTNPHFRTQDICPKRWDCFYYRGSGNFWGVLQNFTGPLSYNKYFWPFDCWVIWLKGVWVPGHRIAWNVPK